MEVTITLSCMQGRGYCTVLAGMYRLGMCTGTKTPMFCTGLNTGCTGHTGRFGAFRPVLGVLAGTKKKLFYFILSFVIFKFL